MKPDWPYRLRNPFAAQNPFLGAPGERLEVPPFEQARGQLPRPHWAGHDAEIACYWRAWELAWAHLRQPTPENGFQATYLDTAFHGSLFLWDSAFVTLFGTYARRVLDLRGTLDTFYARQDPDGFMCKEFRGADGQPVWERHDPSSTGPNVLAWAEWQHHRATADRARLARVFPVLVAYHQWLRAWRTWPDGSYWTNGIASGMDNQPRARRAWPGQGWRHPTWQSDAPPNWPDDVSWLHHAHLSWVDATAQAELSARTLHEMAAVLNRADEVPDLIQEADHLSTLLNTQLWDEAAGFYLDGLPDGTRSDVKTVGAYWALLGKVPPERARRMIAQLSDPLAFGTPHRAPSLAANDPAFEAVGGYWLGSVWPPTNHLLLKVLERHGRDDLAHELASEHLAQVTRAFLDTGTLWENYNPLGGAPGNAALPDFVGWSGLGPVAGLLEHVLGLRPDAVAGRLVWDVRLLDAHGVQGYPFGMTGVLDLACAARTSQDQPPEVRVSSSLPLDLELRWAGGHELRRVGAEVGT